MDNSLLINQQVQSEDIWYEFFNKCIQICAESVEWLISEKEQEMLELPDTVIDEIFERAVKMRQQVYHPEYVRFLLRYKNMDSVFDYLVGEKEKT